MIRVVGCVLVAAGSGTRLGAAGPKAFVEVAGTTLLVHAFRRLMAARAPDGAPLLASLAVVVPAGHGSDVAALLERERPDGHPAVVSVVDGGANRQASVARGLARLDEATTVVLVHDAARALAPVELVEQVAAAVAGPVVAVVPGLAVVDTIKRVADRAGSSDEVAGPGLRLVRETLPRAQLVQVQTPQGFTADLLREVHGATPADEGPGAGDDAGMVEAAGHAVHVVPGHPHALKITVPQDLLLAEVLGATAPDLL
ncbi:IspD/TarI family cytidylyltransferase [Aquipuribacter sp. MA13-6]|uniref:IspD/TarI family cytidylyltransferase n=1 Tax=unclassified Aquipuribacter TaxID=2635084 RepID=UPI003EEAC04D